MIITCRICLIIFVEYLQKVKYYIIICIQYYVKKYVEIVTIVICLTIMPMHKELQKNKQPTE